MRYSTCKLKDLQTADRRIIGLIEGLMSAANINRLIGPEFQTILDDTILLQNKQPIVQYREGVAWPFLHDLIPFCELNVTPEFLDTIKAYGPEGLEGFNFYGLPNEPMSMPELASGSEIHLFPKLKFGESVLQHLASKQRNAIGDMELPTGTQFEEVKYHGDVERLIPNMCCAWLLKHNVDDVWNIAQEWMTWLWVVENMRVGLARVFALHYGDNAIALIGFVNMNGHWVFQAFWQLPSTLADSANLPADPMGTKMLGYSIDHLAMQLPILLTWPSFSGPEVQPYEAYKRKFSVERRIVLAYYGTNGVGYTPFYNMNTGKIE